MVFTNIYNPRAEIVKMDQVRRTLVKKGATIGANATIICGVTLGYYSFHRRWKSCQTNWLGLRVRRKAIPGFDLPYMQ
jgi:hypothetical protein